MNSLYEKDLAAWVSEQISHLRNKDFEKIDIENFIEEVEGIVRSDKRSMKSFFEIIICHLLKIKYQPTHRTRSWYFSIEHAQNEIKEILKDSPSLKNNLRDAFEKAWSMGLKKALSETGLKISEMPKNCPWTCQEVMNMKLEISDFR